MHLASLIVIPAHRHLEHAQSGALREEEQFDVEAEAIDLRLLDDRPSGFHPEGFEAALRVGKRKTGRQAHDRVEDLAALFAPPRLAMADQAAIERTGAEDDVVIPASIGSTIFGNSVNGVERSASEKTAIGA